MGILRGDSKYACGYEKPLSESDAQTMTDLLCEATHIQPVKIYYSNQNTRRLWGRFNPKLRRIKVNPKGRNEGTIIHELAHHWNMNHGVIFKDAQRALIKIWYGI